MLWKLRAEGLDFVDRAPFEFLTEADLPASAERVFEVFADIHSWPRWFDDMHASRWTGPQQSGVGATRLVSLGLIEVDETMLVWEPGARFSFRLDTATLPLIRAMVEDYRLTPTATGCHLSWRAAYEPTLLTRLLHPIIRFVFNRQFKRTAEGLKRYLAQPG